jgi:hypothetical protein
MRTPKSVLDDDVLGQYYRRSEAVIVAPLRLLVTHGVFRMSIEQSVRELRDDGFCLVEDVIPADRIDSVRASLSKTIALERKRSAATTTGGVSFVAGLIGRDQSFAPYVADQRLLGLAEALLGAHMRISFTSAIFNEPGNPRGNWHADWPFNQRNAGHISAPYPDACMHLTSLWMISPFTRENGGTLIVPGSHRTTNNPTGNNGVDPDSPYPSELLVTGNAGSVILFDSRLWHCPNTNQSSETRVALAVRYAPWWLNLDLLRPGSDERKRMVDEPGATENQVPPVPAAVFEQLPPNVKPLFRHWVERGA